LFCSLSYSESRKKGYRFLADGLIPYFINEKIWKINLMHKLIPFVNIKKGR
jgi:hypothetical protein